MNARQAREDELSTCLAIRREVFIEEQAVPEHDEVDGLDPTCAHFIAHIDGEAAGAARMRVVDGHAKMERVAVRAKFRGRKLGDALMDAMEAHARELGHRDAVLSAQVQVIPFYEKRGWIAEGPLFMDAGIAHRAMRKAL